MVLQPFWKASGVVSGIAHEIISHQVSFYFLLYSFILDKEENLLFQYIRFEPYCGIYRLLYILPGLEKRHVHSNVSLFAKCVTLLEDFIYLFIYLFYSQQINNINTQQKVKE